MSLMKKWMLLQVVLFSLALPAIAAPPVPRGPEFRIHTRLDTNFDPMIAAFPDGGFVVVWNGFGIQARFLDAQGRPRREVSLAVRGIPRSVVADQDGSFLVAYEAIVPSTLSTGIFVRRFNRDGSLRGKQIRVSNVRRFNRTNPVIAIGEEGRFAVAWTAEARDPETDTTHTNAVGRIFTAAGDPLTPEIVLLAGDPPSPAGDDGIDAFASSVALKPDGTLVALVQDLENSCIQSYLARVSPQGTRLPLLGLGSVSCGSADFRNVGASLAMGRDGSLIAAWSDARAWAQRFAPNGTARGEAFLVSSNAQGERNPAVALRPNGSFVITWSADDGDGEGLGIFGRSFAANGRPLTEDYQINTTTDAFPFEPAIAASRRLPLYVVVWTQSATLEDPFHIFARVLAPQPQEGE